MFLNRTSLLLIAVLLTSSFSFATSALAITSAPLPSGIVHDVLDHPDGNLATPFYALRLDGLDGNESNDFTFSAESGGAALTILFDSLADTITISGTVFGGQVADNAYVAPQLWDLNFVYTGINDLGGALEATPGGGIGSITALGSGGSPVGGFGVGQTFNLEDNANNAGLAFRIDFGHRLPTEDVVTGRGWVRHDGSGDRVPAQDWLFTIGSPGTPIPEPGSAILLGLGLAGLGAAGGRKDPR